MNGLRASCVFAFFVLLTPASAEPVAMRAPLSIIPEAARTQFGMSPQKPVTGDAKLAPRAAARQMNRAVRAVASVPGSTSDIVQIGQLGALQDAPVGLEPGLGPDVWSGARLTYVVEQMSRLPEKFELQTLRALELQLHRGQAGAPAGTMEGMSWFGARLNRFLSLGDTDSVLALAQLTGAANIDAYVAAAVVDAHLARRDDESACARPLPKKNMPGFRTTKPYFLRLQIFCQMRAGQVEKVALAVELNEKSLNAHKWFADLAYRISVGSTLGDLPPPPAQVDYLDLALARHGKISIPVDVSVLPRAAVPELAADSGQPTQTQLDAALQVIADGLLPPEKFTEIALRADMRAIDARALPAPNSLQGGGSGLPFFVRYLDDAAPAEMPRLLHMALQQARVDGTWAAAVLILAEHLRAVAFADHGTASGPAFLDVDPLRSVTLGLLYLNDFIAAENLLSQYAALPEISALARFAANIDDGSIAASTQLASLVSLDSLGSSASPDIAKTPSNNPVPDIVHTTSNLFISEYMNASGFDWDSFRQYHTAASRATQAYLGQQVGVWQVFDPDGRSPALPAAFAAQLGLDAPTPRQQRYGKLAVNGWLGDLVLALVADFGEMPPAQLSGADLMYMLNALVIAGQEKAARDLALEVLTRHLAALGPEDIAFLDPTREFDALPQPPVLELGSDTIAPDVSAAAPDEPSAELPVENGIYFPVAPPDNGRTDQPDG